jgi:hypothetical protein
VTRRIVTVRPQSTAGGPPPDNYAARIVKYVPADIVAAWLALVALLSPGGTAHRGLLWALFAVLLLLTPIWTVRVTRQEGRSPARIQAAVTTAAFVVWVFATGAPFAWLDFYDPAYGGAAIVVFTLGTGLITPTPDDRPVAGGGG